MTAVPAASPMRWIALALAIVALDQVTKAAVQGSLRPGDEIPLLPFLSLVLTFNTGAAFSFLAGQGGWQRWLFAAVAGAAIVFIVWLLRKGGHRMYLWGLALILGGAIGNLIDRLRPGSLGVVDFIDIGFGDARWPTFNVADIAVSMGAFLLAIVLWSEERPEEQKVGMVAEMRPESTEAT